MPLPPEREGDPAQRRPDITLISGVYGWQPAIDLTEGLTRMIDWFRTRRKASMSVLVTGGAGYIGSHTVRRLTALGHEVVVLDSMEYGHRNAVIEAELVEGNIADLDLVVELCSTARHHTGRALRRVQERRRIDGAAVARTGSTTSPAP